MTKLKGIDKILNFILTNYIESGRIIKKFSFEGNWYERVSYEHK